MVTQGKVMNRITWIDNLRGFGVLAVIFLHCSIAVNNNMGHFSELSIFVNSVMAPVRLGLMFFVSGMFVDAGIKMGVKTFVFNKVKSILYPFAVWVFIYAGLKIFLSSIANHPQSVSNVILYNLTGGGDITWFLHSLFIFFVVIAFLRKLPFYIVFLSCMTISLLLPPIPVDSVFSSFDNYHINKSLYLFVFFFLGDLMVREKVDVENLVRNSLFITLSFISFLTLSCLNIFMVNKFPVQVLSPLALLSIPVFIWFSFKIKSKLVYYVGVNSIVFYLTHYLAIQFFSKFVSVGDGSLWWQDVKFILAFIFSILGPWMICLLRNKGILTYLFSIKKSSRSRPVVSDVEVA